MPSILQYIWKKGSPFGIILSTEDDFGAGDFTFRFVLDNKFLPTVHHVLHYTNL